MTNRSINPVRRLIFAGFIWTQTKPSSPAANSNFPSKTATIRPFTAKPSKLPNSASLRFRGKFPTTRNSEITRSRSKTDDGDEVGNQSFKVSRYDLPNFAVTAKPDKTFYLPDDKTAEITVSADYLFGKPVTKGRARVVQENERRWNWREQKYEAEEKQSVEGAANAEGKYIAKIDLSEELAELRSSSWQRFKDLHFAAYFTDLTTNRTEQRRFDIRLTKEPIHIYLIQIREPIIRNLPFTAYVSTFYADGTPAVCDVEVKGEDKTVDAF